MVTRLSEPVRLHESRDACGVDSGMQVHARP